MLFQFPSILPQYIVDALHVALNPLDDVIVPWSMHQPRQSSLLDTLISPPLNDELCVPLGRLFQGHRVIPIPAVIACLLGMLGDV